MFHFKREYYSKSLVPNTLPIEIYDEKMVNESGVEILFKQRDRDFIDEFEYKDNGFSFKFGGLWEQYNYIVLICGALNGIERAKWPELSPSVALKIISDIKEALMAWPLDGYIYKSARVNIDHPVNKVIYFISGWRSWERSGLSASVPNWR